MDKFIWLGWHGWLGGTRLAGSGLAVAGVYLFFGVSLFLLVSNVFQSVPSLVCLVRIMQRSPACCASASVKAQPKGGSARLAVALLSLSSPVVTSMRPHRSHYPQPLEQQKGK